MTLLGQKGRSNAGINATRHCQHNSRQIKNSLQNGLLFGPAKSERLPNGHSQLSRTEPTKQGVLIGICRLCDGLLITRTPVYAKASLRETRASLLIGLPLDGTRHTLMHDLSLDFCHSQIGCILSVKPFDLVSLRFC